MKRLYCFFILASSIYSVSGAALATQRSDTPEDCPLSAFPKWTVTSFKWYNGSKSLDCGTDEGRKVTFCPDDGGPPETCPGRPLVAPCSQVGLRNYQPWGYTPPASLDMTVENGESCKTGTDALYTWTIGNIGHGQVNCGYMPIRAGFFIQIWGSTNFATSTVNMTYSPQRDWYPCRNVVVGNYTIVQHIQYSGATTFTMKCEHDAFFNATCTADPFEIPVLSWQLEQIG